MKNTKTKVATKNKTKALNKALVSGIADLELVNAEIKKIENAKKIKDYYSKNRDKQKQKNKKWNEKNRRDYQREYRKLHSEK